MEIIANPIYDVVFKYLFDDKKLAKFILSLIIGEIISELEFKATELRKEDEAKFRILRIDFAAKIKTSKGTKVVLIELQKAKLPTDISRFRNYLGTQYSSEDNMHYTATGSRTVKTGIPIIAIYFFGHKICDKQAPMIKAVRKIEDAINGEIIEESINEIESLSHDSYYVQIPHIQRNNRRNELEVFLSIFDQSQQKETRQLLELNPDEYSNEYKAIIRRLRQAAASAEVRRDMKVEDEITDELENLERTIQQKEKELKKERGEKEIAQKQVVELAKMLKSLGVKIKEIAEKTGLSIEEIENL